jgi:hypothetical protein
MTINKCIFDINDIVCATIFTFERAIEEKHWISGAGCGQDYGGSGL